MKCLCSFLLLFLGCAGKVQSVSEILEDEVGGGAEIDLGITPDPVSAEPIGMTHTLEILVL